MSCNCGISYNFICTREKADQYYDFFQCPRCGKPEHAIRYKYQPHNCPGHQFEHMGTEFIDDIHRHQINHVHRCDRCGCVRKVPRDTYGAGISGRVEVDHPKVANQLLWNQTVFDRYIDSDIKDISRGEIQKESILPDEVSV
jgi:hypothetical protein